MNQVDVVAAGRDGPERPPKQARLVALSSAAAAVVLVALVAWFAGGWWEHRSRPALPRSLPGPVTLVLLNHSNAGSTPGAFRVTFTLLLINGGSQRLTIVNLLWGDRTVVQASGESLSSQRWTFVDITTPLPCPAPGASPPDPPVVIVQLRGSDGAVVRSRLSVLNRAVWDQVIFGPDCTARPPG
jgi:hypothetical protein